MSLLLVAWSLQASDPVPAARVAAGGSHTVVVTPLGDVWTWGANDAGQLGHATVDEVSVPTKVPGLAGVVAVAAGESHTVALDADGVVWQWGTLGDTPAVRTPTRVPGLSRVSHLASGARHVAALSRDGQLFVWGANDAGQLGDDTTLAAAVPLRIETAAPIARLATGTRATRVTLRDGRTLAWGRPDAAPDPALAAFSRFPWAEVSVGPRHAIAVTPDLRVFTWGSNSRGALGDGTLEARPEPTLISEAGFRWRTATPRLLVVSGEADSAFVQLVSVTPGAVVRYTLDGSAPDAASAQAYPSDRLTVTDETLLQAQAFHATMPPSNLVRRRIAGREAPSAGTPRADTSASTLASTPVVAEPPASARSPRMSSASSVAPALAAGLSHSLALTDTQAAWAWGANANAQLGDGSTTQRPTPVTISGLTTATSLSGGGAHSGALKDDQTVALWGANGSGQLGDGTTTQRSTPTTLTSPTSVTAIATGSSHTLALKGDGTVVAWGQNSSGQLGDGTQTERTSPVSVSGLANVVAIAAGGTHSLALKSDGTVVAWGNNTNAQLGDGTTTMRTAPVAVSSLSNVAAIVAGGYHSLARKTDGTMVAWGANNSGQLGDGSFTQRATPVGVTGLTGIVAASAGVVNSLALKSDGTVVAWGSNANGELGNGTTTLSTSPTAVSTLADIVTIAAGGNHGLALTSTGVAWAWGRNANAQIGDGTTRNRLTPVAISEDGFAWKVATPTISVPSGTYQAAQTVVIACATPGATIRYTTTGVDPTETDTVVASGGSVTVTESLTLKVKAWKSGMPASNVDGATYTLKVPTPSLSPGTGTYATPPSVVVSVGVTGVTLRYTTTGVDPTESDPVVASGGTVVIDQPATLKVRGWKPGWATSDVASATYMLKVGAPTLTPGGGSYAAAATVTIATVTPSATIHYTTTGVEPTTADPTIASGGTVVVGVSATVKARAVRSGWTASDTTTASYVLALGTVATPTFTPGGGTYASAQTVTVSSTTSGATIRYTTDGTDPTTTSAIYTAPVAVAADATLKARAFKADWGMSAIGTATYVIDTGAVATPTISPGTGPLAAARFVTVAVSTAGATIRYTLNGLEPTETDPVVTSGGTVLVDKALRLKVKAWKTGLTASGVRAADYWLTGAVAAGQYHTLALTASGQVYAWGDNTNGQLGDGTTVSKSSPTLVSGLTDVVAIAAGARHSLAVTRTGALWTWGQNTSGQLGDATTTQRTSPVQVTALSSVAGVAAGQSHSLAVTTAGSVYTWGNNGWGQLADGTFAGQRATPYAVPGLAGVIAVAAGAYHSLAVRTDGTSTGVVWSWGRNASSELGDGTTANRSTPVAGLHEVATVDGGATHTLAVRADGSTWGWGANWSGQLGDGTTTTRTTPTLIAMDGPAARTALGDGFSLVLAADATAWGAGAHNTGQTGDIGQGTPNRLRPARILHAGASVTNLAAGEAHGVALRGDGRVVAWGLNQFGQVGNGTTTLQMLPVLVPNFSVFDNSWHTGDPDADGLTTDRELAAGTDPADADTNDDGLLDGAALQGGVSATSPDVDGDGLANLLELTRGTDPRHADTDRDGVLDGVDAFPLDPTRSQGPTPVPGDTTPPVITLIAPPGAVLLPPP